ncbi:uncharacterized protein K444DRAFT_303056 [Hyaloscypha bicolor E]|uniref:Cora-domain-containing protein n=1 Tax=Hyaloscypha bicolor E TaxID=1095630 RepID=A0A2J6TN57_9HELO|nr:uncharacterized protein K444DRAFT_303056 [Hyaloscypha bicolor E]PMD64437.1 hypothetical protein K444DRAFT_303056 [Hyaloscypha bicolor E]
MGDSEDATSDPTKIYYTPSSRKEKGPSQATSLISGNEAEGLSSPRNEIETTQSTSVISGKEVETPPRDTESPEEIGTTSGQQVSRTKRIADRLTAEKNMLKDNLSEKVERIASRRGSRPPQSHTISQPSPPDAPKTKIPEIFRWPVGEDGSLDDEDIPGSPSLKTESSFHSNTRSSGAKGEMLFTVLKDAHEQLKSYLARFPVDFDVFNNTEKATQDEVYELMKAVARRSRGAEDKQADWQLLIDTAQQLLQSFTPPTVDEHLVGIFWGSLARILRTAETHPNRDMASMYSRAQHYLTIIEEILNGVSVSSSQSKPRYRIPDALVPAFEHLVMVFCIFGSNTELSPRLHEAEMRHHRRCVDLLIKGKNQLILIHAGDLSEANMYRAVDSEGLAALMFKQIVYIASRGEKKPNILVAYQNYMTKLELQVLEAPSVRVFDDIQDLVQELTIIETILRQQRTVLEGSLALFGASAKSQDAFSLITLAKALQDVRKQLNNVTELLQMAQNKKNLLSQAISIRKETNNQAILVFTIVTVIFLPLSFMTSYLGMNSIDIRNAAFTQLRFWELAIPLTVIVLVAVWALVKFKRRYSRWIRGIVKYSFRRCFR